ncbi:hypothetical protein STEG23_018651, partial [Scotinomys teguina]
EVCLDIRVISMVVVSNQSSDKQDWKARFKKREALNNAKVSIKKQVIGQRVIENEQHDDRVTLPMSLMSNKNIIHILERS